MAKGDRITSQAGAQAGRVAAKAAIKAAGVASGTATGGLGYIAAEAGSRVATFANRHKGDIGKYGAAALGAVGLALGTVVGALGAGVAALGSAVIAAVIGIPLVVIFFFFMINNAALVVPPASQITGSVYAPGIDVGATCPIPGGVILVGPYGYRQAIAPYGHGENDYWNAVAEEGVPPAQACFAYTLSGCYARQPGDYCSLQGTCQTYGLAIDVVYPGRRGSSAGNPAYLPFIQGQPVDWVLVRLANATGGTIRTELNGTVYEMYASHLVGGPRAGRSGGIMGIINLDDHVHIELRIDGQWVDPLSMCVGSGTQP